MWRDNTHISGPKNSATKLANMGFDSHNRHAHVLFLAPAAEQVSAEHKEKTPISLLTGFSGRFLSNSYPGEPKTTWCAAALKGFGITRPMSSWNNLQISDISVVHRNFAQSRVHLAHLQIKSTMVCLHQLSPTTQHDLSLNRPKRK